jgi:CBS domain-containing protein
MTSSAIQSYQSGYLMAPFDHAHVADAMHPGILSCPPEATLKEIARVMSAHMVHCIAVMGVAHDTFGESLVWGLISDMDLVRARVHGIGDETARTLAQQPIISITPATPLREACELMLTHTVTHLVVIEPESQGPIGILSTLDVAAMIAWDQG